ncbi:MAG: Xylulose kinase [uncultured Thermomicrobiales bacterium]|uniref:Xylulose kinase n=1 Tax=uncultured Thermomicrobiales bacterium TaxID=1645740 RepID=A0A6J4VKY3_9BACT|nr:MAG: Xylulose kinase [uncultured Thermomicrobiales bacterium]
MTDLFLGIDLGTSSVKVLVVDEAGRVRGSGSAGYPVDRPQPGYAEQDPEAWWRATGEAARQALGWAGPGAGSSVAGIGLSGQMHGTVLLGDDDRPIAPAIIWADQRAGKQVRSIPERVGAARLIELTGSPVAAGFQAATIRWLQEERSSLWWKTRRVLLPKDELRRRLVGEIATDPSDGSGTLLLDVRWRDWSPEVLTALEIAIERLPPVQESIAVAGGLGAEAAEALGLPASTPVVVGAGDAPSGLLGAGIVDPATMLLSLSTGSQVMVPARGVHPDPGGRTHTFCAALEPTAERPGWYQMGATLAAGMAMGWLRDRVFDLRGEDANDRIAGWAGEAPLGSDGLLFLPYLAGERTPHMDPAARGAFLGLTARHGRAELARAVMEGVTLACLDAFDVLREQGAAPDRIVIAGGGARSPVWRQMAADVFALPVHALATVDQAALGAALLAAVGVRGADPIATAHAWADQTSALEPNPSRHARYRELGALFRDAYAQVSETSHRLAAFEAPAGERVTPRRPRR